MGIEDNSALSVDTTFVDAPPASTEVTAPEPKEPATGRMSVRDVLARNLAERREKGGQTVQAAEEPEDPLAPPVDEGQDRARSQVARDAQGRFAPQTKEEQDAALAADPQVADQAPQAAQAQVASMPPPGFSVASKQAWDQLPESVRADIAKREQEIDAGMRRYAGLGRFAEQAEKNGRSLGQVMNSYVALEGELRKDIVGGVGYLCDQLGVEAPALAKALAVKYLGLHPSVINDLVAGRAAEGNPAAQGHEPQRPTLDPRQIAAEVYQQVRADREQDEADRAIAEFASKPEHKFFANVRPVMAALMSSGQAESLKQAYDAACWMNPEIRATLINEQSRTGARKEAVAVDRAKAAAKAVGGAPAGGGNQDTASPAPQKGASIRDVLKHNLALQRGNA